MPSDPRDIRRCLLHKLGFTEDKGRDHHWYTLILPSHRVVRTKVGRHSRDYGSVLEGKMARQLRVNVTFFRELVSCTKSREDYIAQVETHPVPPWNTDILS